MLSLCPYLLFIDIFDNLYLHKSNSSDHAQKIVILQLILYNLQDEIPFVGKFGNKKGIFQWLDPINVQIILTLVNNGYT